MIYPQTRNNPNPVCLKAGCVKFLREIFTGVKFKGKYYDGLLTAVSFFPISSLLYYKL
jgi:hypothetical protein